MLKMFSRPLVASGLIVLWLLAVAVPALWLHHDGYSNYTAGVQAFGLVLALGVGAWTVAAAARNSQVDRVLALHAELTSGDTDRARRHLASHLRTQAVHPALVRQVKISELRTDPALKTYPAGWSSTPSEDAILVVRFFERARLAQYSGSLDDAMTAELLGRHAAWWNHAIEDEGQTSRRALDQFASWANEFARKYAGRYPYLENWGNTRIRDFGDV